MAEALGFPQWLRQRRVELGLTQEQLALATACSVSLIRKVESGARQPSRAVTERLARALHLSEQERVTFLVRAQQGATFHTQAADPPVSGWLPIPPSPLLGREEALADLTALIFNTPGRMISLVGPPGAGKSRLALALALALRHDFADGAWLIELAPLSRPDQLVEAIAVVLGVQTGFQVERDLKTYLASRRLLLVLDNCEHLTDAATLIAELLAAAPHLFVLTTTRRALHIRAEMQFTVEPLAQPATAAIGTVATAPASALFCQRAVAVAPKFQLTLANAPDIVAICQLLDGLPLAIELAAAHCDQFTIAELLARLQANALDLDERFVDLPAHQRTLHAMIAWSERLLAEGARHSFARLSVFRGGFAAAAAVAVGAFELQILVEHGLLQRDNERYIMLETLRSYAAQQLATHTDAAVVEAAHAHYFAELAEQLGPQLNAAQGLKLLEELRSEIANLRTAIDWSLRYDGGLIAARITNALRNFWLRSGFGRDGRRIEGLLLSPNASSIPLELRTQSLLVIAFLASQQGDPQMKRALDAALQLARAANLHDELARGLTIATMVARYPGNLARCRVLLEEAILLARRRHNRAALAGALNQLGVMYCENNQPQAALAALEEAIAVAEELGHVTIVHQHRSDLAEAWCMLGAEERARREFMQLLAEEAAAPGPVPLWETQLRLAKLDIADNDLSTAAQRLALVRPVVAQMDIHYGRTLLLRAEGLLALAQHDYATAQHIFRQSIERCITSFFIEELVASLIGLAATLNVAGFSIQHSAFSSMSAAHYPSGQTQAARSFGAALGLCKHFPVRIDAPTQQLLAQLSAACARDQDAVDDAAHRVRERIRRVAFDTAFEAMAQVRLDLLIPAALRGK
jgi:predicted ATPase/transcriptional regulator with XRE-family HTH domain